ncbi:hypothetical protein [Facilibium subflavum]|uniref:hypothetical protein n=1 Tax=Facilibium subflavum TaxID=2219058 RepID=UPI000E656AB5|nr:hypothetical protein [Facilibium subflavum]
MSQTKNIKSAYYSFVIIAASLGAILFWQIPKLSQSYYNITFIIAYAICLFFIALPMVISESAFGMLSQKLIRPSMRYITRSGGFNWLSLLIMLGALIVLVVVINSLHMITQSAIYTGYWHFAKSADKLPLFIHNFSSPLSVIITTVVLILIFVLHKMQNFTLERILALIGLGLFIALFVYLMINFRHDDSPAVMAFFDIKLYLFNDIMLWYHAITLALLSSFVGVGIHLTTGQYLPTKLSLRKFCFTFITGNIILSLLTILIFKVLTTQTLSHLYQPVTLAQAYALSLLYFITLFICLILAATLLCRVFQITKDNKRSLWRVTGYVALLVIVFIYQFILPYNLQNWLSSSFLICLILFIAYMQTLLFGWIFDAQKLTYQLYKQTNIKFSAVFNVTLRLIAPGAILSLLLMTAFSDFIMPSLMVGIVFFIISLIVTIILGSLLHKRFQ